MNNPPIKPLYSSLLRILLVFSAGSLISLSSLAQQQQEAEDLQATENQETQEQQAEIALEDLPTEPVVTLEEIVVTAQRPMRVLRIELDIARAAFFDSYNVLNMNDEFDVTCRESDWTGTRVQEEICIPKFFDDATSEAVRMGFINGDFSAVNANFVARQNAKKFEELSANIISIANEHPKIAESLMEVGKLEAAIRSKQEECEENGLGFLFLRLCK